MNGEGSVSAWIGRLKAGDQDGYQQLWQRYIERLVALARAGLRDAPRLAADEEDVALSALDTLFRRAGQGCFARLKDRDDLWSLLVVIPRRKAANLLRHEQAQRQGGGCLRHSLDEEDGPLLGALVGKEPDPAFAAEFADG